MGLVIICFEDLIFFWGEAFHIKKTIWCVSLLVFNAVGKVAFVFFQEMIMI